MDIKRVKENLRKIFFENGMWYANNDHATRACLASKIKSKIKITGSKFRCPTPAALDKVLRSIPSDIEGKYLHEVIYGSGITASVAVKTADKKDAVIIVRWNPDQHKKYVPCVVSNMDCVIVTTDQIYQPRLLKSARDYKTVYLGVPPVLSKKDKEKIKSHRKTRKNKLKALKVLAHKSKVAFLNGELIVAARAAGFHLRIKTYDTYGNVIPLPLMKKLLAFNKIDERRYVADTGSGDNYDCDDFADDLRYWFKRVIELNSFGFVCDDSSRHAYNCFFSYEKKNEKMNLQCHAIEPQNDNFIKLGSDKFKGKEGFIII